MISEFSKTEVYYRTHEAHVQSLTKLDLDVNVKYDVYDEFQIDCILFKTPYNLL